MTTEKYPATQRQIISRKQNRVLALLGGMLQQEELLFTTLKELKADAKEKDLPRKVYNHAILASSGRQKRLIDTMESVREESKEGELKKHREHYPYRRDQKVRKYEGVEE